MSDEEVFQDENSDGLGHEVDHEVDQDDDVHISSSKRKFSSRVDDEEDEDDEDEDEDEDEAPGRKTKKRKVHYILLIFFRQ